VQCVQEAISILEQGTDGAGAGARRPEPGRGDRRIGWTARGRRAPPVEDRPQATSPVSSPQNVLPTTAHSSRSFSVPLGLQPPNLQPPRTTTHCSGYKSRGAQSFLLLNTLAEDLRALRDVPGIDTVLHDLKRTATADSARHVIHGAALFARGKPSSVVRFLEQRSDTVPDFVLHLDDQDIAVEAKLLSQSEPEEAFGVCAMPIVNHLHDRVIPTGTINPEVYVILKQHDCRPTAAI
jgi:hypothetical protein